MSNEVKEMFYFTQVKVPLLLREQRNKKFNTCNKLTFQLLLLCHFTTKWICQH